jgi:hypothetical protein
MADAGLKPAEIDRVATAGETPRPQVARLPSPASSSRLTKGYVLSAILGCPFKAHMRHRPKSSQMDVIHNRLLSKAWGQRLAKLVRLGGTRSAGCSG